MHGEASKKVPNGKLVNIEVQYSDVFEDVEIRGDFFLEPPQALEAIESRLEGLPVDSEREEIIDTMKFVNADLIGFSYSDIVDVLFKATGRGDEA